MIHPIGSSVSKFIFFQLSRSFQWICKVYIHVEFGNWLCLLFVVSWERSMLVSTFGHQRPSSVPVCPLARWVRVPQSQHLIRGEPDTPQHPFKLLLLVMLLGRQIIYCSNESFMLIQIFGYFAHFALILSLTKIRAKWETIEWQY